MRRILGLLGLIASLWIVMLLYKQVIEQNFGDAAGAPLGQESAVGVGSPTPAVTNRVRDRLAAAQERAAERLSQQLGDP